MSKLVCTDCNMEYRPLKNSVTVIEMFSEPPRPYGIWMADLWSCPNCKKQVVCGFGRLPYTQHFERNFNIELERAEKRGHCYRIYEQKQQSLTYVPGGQK